MVMVTVSPEELSFPFELDKQSYCHLKVTNNSEHHVAFKVKTTSPKKYYVRPNTGTILPWDLCMILVTLQAQKEVPSDMQCKDKFLVQSVLVPPDTDPDAIPPDTFNKDNGKPIEEYKLKVVYTAPSASTEHKSLEEHLFMHSAMLSSRQHADANSMYSAASSDESLGVSRLKEERDAALREQQQLRQELEILRKIPRRKPGYSFLFLVIAGVVGFSIGFILKLVLSGTSSSSNQGEL